MSAYDPKQTSADVQGCPFKQASRADTMGKVQARGGGHATARRNRR